jgi:hypothetical protein
LKLKPASAAGLLAIMAALALSACAAPATVVDSGSQRTTTHHSHLQEKHGILPRAPEATPDKVNAAYDRTKHFHPRDGK